MWNDVIGAFNAATLWSKPEPTASEERQRRQDEINEEHRRAVDSIREKHHVNRTRQGRELVEKILKRTNAERAKQATMPPLEVRITRSQACLLYDYCPAVRGSQGIGLGSSQSFKDAFLTLNEKVSRVDGGTLDGARLVVVPDPVVIDMTKE